MTIGELNRRISILRPVVKRDEYGGEETFWAIADKVWAKIEPGKGTEFFQSQQVQAEHTTKFTVRYYPKLDVMHRICYQDKTYEIIGISDIMAEHKWTVITAKERVSDGLQRKAEEGEGFGAGCGQTCTGTEVNGRCRIIGTDARS